MTNLIDLQSLADEAAESDQPELNEFPVPQGCDCDGSKTMEIIDFPEKNGKGFVAKQDIKAGTLVLAAKPVSLVMDWEEDVEDDEDEMYVQEDEEEEEEDNDVMKGSRRNGMIVLKAAKKMKDDPSLWHDEITNLFPRDYSNMPIWICDDVDTGMLIEEAINDLGNTDGFSEEDVEEIKQRLPLIIRYNVLSVETAPELFVHPNQSGGGHVTLSGTALYYYPSYFNHACKPNVARYSIGDVMFFVTNQNILKGEELCISYIEAEILCESSQVRSKLIDMDFQEDSEGEGKNTKSEGYEDSAPMIDIEMQEELMSIHPLQRIDEIQGLLKDAVGGGKSISVEMGDEIEVFWFRCDEHQLRILLALTYDSLGQTSKALDEWKKCVTFVDENFPPVDENGTALRVQAALSAYTLDVSEAKLLAEKALMNHNILFGGGIQLFRKRYANEFKLKLRPESKQVKDWSVVVDALWPTV